MHEAAQPAFGSSTTAPEGRQAFASTSFGDQGAATLGKRCTPPDGVGLPNPGHAYGFAAFDVDRDGTPATRPRSR